MTLKCWSQNCLGSQHITFTPQPLAQSLLQGLQIVTLHLSGQMWWKGWREEENLLDMIPQRNRTNRRWIYFYHLSIICLLWLSIIYNYQSTYHLLICLLRLINFQDLVHTDGQAGSSGKSWCFSFPSEICRLNTQAGFLCCGLEAGVLLLRESWVFVLWMVIWLKC